MFYPRNRTAKAYDLHRANYTVLDTETTGFEPGKDRILSIGLVKMQNGKILLKSALELFIQYEGNLGHSPTIHGITMNALEGGMPAEEALRHTLDFIGTDTVVAHYASFDRRMLEELARMYTVPWPELRWLDTMDVEVGLNPSAHRQAHLLKLDQLLADYQIPALDRHTALGDAYATARVLQKQLALCKTQGIQYSSSLQPPRTGLL